MRATAKHIRSSGRRIRRNADLPVKAYQQTIPVFWNSTIRDFVPFKSSLSAREAVVNRASWLSPRLGGGHHWRDQRPAAAGPFIR